MKTDVDTALKDIADFYLKNRREMTEPELDAILKKHCQGEAEVKKFTSFLETEPGQLRFKTLLGEREEEHIPEFKPLPLPTEPEALAQRILAQQRLEEAAGRITPVTPEVTLSSGKVVPTIPVTIDQSSGTQWMQRIDELDKLGAKDSEYRGIVSTAGKIGSVSEKAVSSGKSTWRKEVLRLAEDDLKRHPVIPKVEAGREKPSSLKEKPTSWRPEVEGHYRCTKCDWEGYLTWPEFLDAIKWGCPKCGGTIEQVKPSYLKEATAVAETECQLISPEYYDLLGWLGAEIPDYSLLIEPEAKDVKLTETLQKLKDGVSRIHESTLFRDFLQAMSKFHYYSLYNQMLIALQRPTATRVAGFVTWRDEFGRHVKRGEKGISILAPCLPPRILKCPLCEKTFTEGELRTHLVEVHQREDVSILVREAREEAVGVPTPHHFIVVSVFDVLQTEGKPLPEIEVPVLTGAYSEDLYNRLMGLATKHSVTVNFEPMPGLDPQIKGSMIGKSIWVKPDEPEAQRLKTLGHELAHYFTEAVFAIPRTDAEVIAESVAFVVCAHYGFDTGTRSFPYVALWAKEKKVLEQNLASIRKISGRIIEELGV